MGIFRSSRQNFMKKHAAFKDMVQGHMALDIEKVIKIGGRTPVDKGHMKAEVRHFRSASGGFRVEAGKEYSAAQEAGQRKTKAGKVVRFRHYSTPGTGPHWFQRAIDSIISNRVSYINEARKALGL